MSIQTTPFLHLPQWSAEEQPSFLGEINPAWAAIDEGYGDIKTSAGTAITTANAAVNTANSAKIQSQANAGVITQLQQQLEQLQNKFNAQSNLVIDTPQVTTTHTGVTVSTGVFFHNGYIATGHFIVAFNPGTYSFNQETPLFTVTNLPYTWSTIVMLTPEVFGPNTAIMVNSLTANNPISVRMESSGGLYTTTALKISNSVQHIDLIYTVPIFRGTSSRDIRPEQCVFME